MLKSVMKKQPFVPKPDCSDMRNAMKHLVKSRGCKSQELLTFTF